MATVDQYWVAYHVTILFSALLLLQCLFLKETLYPRSLLLSNTAPSTPTNDTDGQIKTELEVKRTNQLGYFVSLFNRT